MDKQDITRIFLPTLGEAIKRVEENQLKLAHYTRFEVAKLIISGRSVWMRNARLMNDVGEINYGIAAMDYAMAEHAELLEKTMASINARMPALILAAWQRMRMNVVKEVFISCFSEHWPKENSYGRLSMWRAYGDPDGVALVLNVEPFRLETNALNAYSSPVFYGETSDFSARFKIILENIADNATELKSSMSLEMILSSVLMAFLFGAVCLKHPGFAEEQEWRIIHMPNIPQPSLLRRRDLDGAPVQTVFEIPLEDRPDKGLVGLAPDALLHKVIIGPSNHASEIAAELVDILAAQGVNDPQARIIQSGIPLRV